MSAAHTFVGVYRARLVMPWVKSLKEKRSIVKPVTERLKARFPVSVARLEGLDAHDWEVIGVVTIHADAIWVRDILDQVAAFVAAQGEYRVTDERLSVQAWDDEDDEPADDDDSGSLDGEVDAKGALKAKCVT